MGEVGAGAGVWDEMSRPLVSFTFQIADRSLRSISEGLGNSDWATATVFRVFGKLWRQRKPINNTKAALLARSSLDCKKCLFRN